MVAGWHQYMWSSNTSIKYRCSMSVEPCWGHGHSFLLISEKCPPLCLHGQILITSWGPFSQGQSFCCCDWAAEETKVLDSFNLIPSGHKKPNCIKSQIPCRGCHEVDADTYKAPSRSDISLPCDSLWRNKSQDYREKVCSRFSAVSENTLSHLSIISSWKVLKISQPQLQVSEGQEGYWRTDEPLWEKNCIVYLLWCILCILDIPTGRTKPTLAPGGLDPALFLMLGYLMAIWSHLSRYWLPVCPLDIAPPPIYFLSCSGFLAILVGSPKAS